MAGLADIHGSLLHMDLKGFHELEAFFKRFPREARHASAQLLNDIAFAGRPVIVDVLARHTHMRNPRFALTRTRVEKTAAREIALQSATLGTIYTQGKGGSISHDGWASLQRGQAPTRDRSTTLAARGGSELKQAQRGARLLPGDLPAPADYGEIENPAQRLQALIRIMGEAGPSKAFVVPKGYGLTPGLYRTKGRYTLRSGKSAPKLMRLQTFGKSPQAQRVPWMQEVAIELRRRLDLGAMWRAAMAKVWARMHPPGA
jgi:hypothetical protein